MNRCLTIIRNVLGSLRNDYPSNEESASKEGSASETGSSDEDNAYKEACPSETRSSELDAASEDGNVSEKGSSNDDDLIKDGCMSETSSSKFDSPIVTSGRRVTTRNTGGSSPLMTGETLGFVDGRCSILDTSHKE
jgi:hypothetical protein